jgi:hypothetical protein
MKDSDLSLKIDKSIGAPLLVMDGNVALWKVIAFIQESEMVYKRNRENLIRLATAYIFNRGPQGLPIQDYRVIVLADGPSEKFGNGYWRHYEVERDPRIQEAWNNFRPRKKDRGYKGGRSAKPDIFYECYNIMEEYCRKYLNFYKFDGFEADDAMGAIFRSKLKNQKDRVKIMYTVDLDWSALCNEEAGFYWYTMRVPRENEMFQEQAKNDRDVLTYAEKKMGITITSPRELAQAKCDFGELGDNLPAGCPLEYIDLSNTHPVYNIESMFPELYAEMIEDALCLAPNNHLDHLEETRKIFEKLHLNFMYRG